nr:hypothetical protein [Mycobacterium sp.]
MKAKTAGQRSEVRSAAIYARISADAKGTGLGVARQWEEAASWLLIGAGRSGMSQIFQGEATEGKN